MTRRFIILRVGVVLISVLFLARLVQLQLVEGERNRRLADENRIRVVRRPAPRGNVYDRKGRVLATSRLAFAVGVVPEDLSMADSGDAVGGLATLLRLPPAELRAILAQPRGAVHEPRIVHRDASRDLVARLEEHSVYVSGVSVIPAPVRLYPEGALAAHVLGYVRQVSSADLEQPENSGYRPGDLIGKAGVEKLAEAFLRGVDGGEQIEVDARGRQVSTLGGVAPRRGNDVWLTLDMDLQRAAEEALGNRPGSVVALDPRTGEVLALVSHPAYDPNLFVGPLSSGEWESLTGPDHPQHNRALMSRYPPGSLLKVVTAAAALESGACTSRSRDSCEGRYRIGDWTLRCSEPGGHGTIDLIQGMAQSCNVMFARLGRRVGPSALSSMARRLGLGHPTGIDLPQEAGGLIPTPEWKEAERGQPWYPGDTCLMAIGQGDCLVTPLQVARLAAVVANGGKLVAPHMVARIEGDGETGQAPAPQSIGLQDETISTLRACMEAVVVPGGTAAHIRSDRYRIAGKTGSAETPLGKAHAWFMGYAPAGQPRLAIAVIVEHGESGGLVAAPVARYVFDTALLPPRQRLPWRPSREDVAQPMSPEV